MSKVSSFFNRIFAAIKDAFTWGEKKTESVDQTVPAAEPVVVATPAAASAGCGCDLSKPLATPPYTAQQLKDLGNTAECPVPFGMDIRLKVFKADGSAWQRGHIIQLHPTLMLTNLPTGVTADIGRNSELSMSAFTILVTADEINAAPGANQTKRAINAIKAKVRELGVRIAEELAN